MPNFQIRGVFLFIWMCVFTSVNAQMRNVIHIDGSQMFDGPKIRLSSFEADSLLVENYNEMALIKSNLSLDSALVYLKKASDIAVRRQIIDLIGVTYFNYGQVYEQHGFFSDAENYYLKWYSIRSKQDVAKYRWALTGMREFYTRHLQLEKLKEIDDEWIRLIDSELDKDVDVMFGYRASVETVYLNLISIGEYYEAEKYFIHLLENEPNYDNWDQSSMFYYLVEDDMLAFNDPGLIKDWHNRSVQTMVKYEARPKDIQLALNMFSSKLMRLDVRTVAYTFEGLKTNAQQEDSAYYTTFIQNWLKYWNKTFLNEENLINHPDLTPRFVHFLLQLNMDKLNYQKEITDSEVAETVQTLRELAESYKSLDEIHHQALIASFNQAQKGDLSKKMRKKLAKIQAKLEV